MQATKIASNENAELVRHFYSSRYLSPYQITVATGISRYRLINLINVGSLRAKRVDSQTVLIELDSFERYLNSLPDVVGEQDHVAPQDQMDSYRAQHRKAMDLFNEAQE